MSFAGLGAVAIWHDVAPEARNDFLEWHNREHMPERVGIPGFRRGRRYLAIDGAPEYFNLYEADSVETLGGQDYRNRLDAPTPWTQRVLPHFRNVSRCVTRVAFTHGVGSGGIMLTLRFAIDAVRHDGTVEALRRRILPAVVYRKGVCGVHLCLADHAVSGIATAERRTRADSEDVPSWVLLVEGISKADVDGAADDIAPTLAAHEARDLRRGVYQLENTRLKTPWAAG